MLGAPLLSVETHQDQIFEAISIIQKVLNLYINIYIILRKYNFNEIFVKCIHIYVQD